MVIRNWWRVLIILIILPGASLRAQSAFTIFNVSNSGLPENSVRCILPAADGRLWVGTDYGLAVKDGASWTVYQTFSSALPDNAVRCLAEDDSGTIWIGTFNGGLASFDGNNWNIYNTSNSGLPDNFVRSITIDQVGNIWAGTIGGLAIYNGTTWQVYNMSNTQLLSNNISALYSDSSMVAVGTINGGDAFINSGIWNYYNIWTSNLPDNSCLGITRDTTGVLWLASPAYGLSAFVGGFAFLTFNTVSSGIQSNSSTCIGYDRFKDQIWIGSNDSGVICKSGLQFNCYNTSNSAMPDNFIQCIAVDSLGIVWVGTQTGGLVRIDPSVLSSLPENHSINELRIYPNPVADRFSIPVISSQIKSITISDTKGRKVKDVTILIDEKNTEADVAQLSSGIYFLRVELKNGNQAVGKFIR